MDNMWAEITQGVLMIMGAVALILVGVLGALALADTKKWSWLWPLGLVVLLAGIVLGAHGINALHRAEIYKYINTHYHPTTSLNQEE